MPARKLDNYLHTHRKRSGLTLSELSFLLGANDAAVAFRYERGRRPSLEAALACQVLFGTSVSQIFPGALDKAVSNLRERVGILREALRKGYSRAPGTLRKLQFLDECSAGLIQS